MTHNSIIPLCANKTSDLFYFMLSSKVRNVWYKDLSVCVFFSWQHRQTAQINPPQTGRNYGRATPTTRDRPTQYHSGTMTQCADFSYHTQPVCGGQMGKKEAILRHIFSSSMLSLPSSHLIHSKNGTYPTIGKAYGQRGSMTSQREDTTSSDLTI